MGPCSWDAPSLAVVTLTPALAKRMGRRNLLLVATLVLSRWHNSYPGSYLHHLHSRASNPGRFERRPSHVRAERGRTCCS